MKFLWPGEGRFQQRFIPHAGAAAVLGELAIMNGEHQRFFEPNDHV